MKIHLAADTRSSPRRLMIIASGSWDRSIVGRNAEEKLQKSDALGFFNEVDYIFFPAGQRSSRMLRPGFRVHEIPGRETASAPATWPSRFRGLRGGLQEILEIATRSPPSVVNAIEPFLSGLVALRVARRYRCPFVATVLSNYRLSWDVGRVNPAPFLPTALSFLLERFVLRSADRIHVDCEYYASYARSRGARPGRIRVLTRYADSACYEWAPDRELWNRLGVPMPAPIVYVGRLSPEKYALDLAIAFLKMRSVDKELRLVVAGGGGPDQQRFIDTISRGGARSYLHVIEGLSRTDLQSAMGTARAMLATHAGYALLEGALAGARVVAYDYEWHPELIRHMKTGRLVPYRNADALARAALETLSNPEHSTEMGKALRDHAHREFHPMRHLQALRESYSDLLQQRHATGQPRYQ